MKASAGFKVDALCFEPPNCWKSRIPCQQPRPDTLTSARPSCRAKGPVCTHQIQEYEVLLQPDDALQRLWKQQKQAAAC